MAGPVLETKLHVPRRRRSGLARPRLSERLSGGEDSTLTLVSAPAGFGKTTLLTEWLADGPGEGRSVAPETDGTTGIHGPVVDQAALHGLLRKLRDVGLPLVSITRVDLDQQSSSTTQPVRPGRETP